MIRVGRGQGATLEESLEQAVAEFQSPQFVLYFSRPGMLDRVSAFFARRYEGIPTMGLCSVCVLKRGSRYRAASSMIWTSARCSMSTVSSRM